MLPVGVCVTVVVVAPCPTVTVAGVPDTEPLKLVSPVKTATMLCVPLESVEVENEAWPAPLIAIGLPFSGVADPLSKKFTPVVVPLPLGGPPLLVPLTVATRVTFCPGPAVTLCAGGL